jgi:hypothetical protein
VDAPWAAGCAAAGIPSKILLSVHTARPPGGRVRSLSSLASGSGDGTELSRVLAALLDSGLVVAVRDGAGRFVQTSPVLGRLLGIDEDVRGRTRIDGLRFFEASGREIAAREHPAFIARTTGEPQRNCTLGYRSRDGAEAWLQMSFLPLERGPEGWSVLGIGTNVTARQRRIIDLEAGTAARERLIELAASSAGGQRTWSDVASAVAPALEDALPTANLFFGIVAPEGLHIEPILQRFPNEFDGRTVRLSAEAASRGASAQTHVNLDVRDTDIYGDRVMAEWSAPFGSIAVVPMYRSDGSWIGSLLALERARHGIRPDQVQLLESAARVCAVALERASASRAA